ncbi:MAG: class I SAM-dependent methyltransferase [Terriglobia bacterium]
MSKKHRAVVQKQFTKTRDAFSKFAVRDSADVVAERVAFAKPEPESLTLDVACGPGAFVLALAPVVRFARGIDVTAPMLSRAKELQRERQITNAYFDQGDAEQLPYPDGAFNLVSCHFAFHHMPKPEAALKEMCRVARGDGRVLIVDTIGPESDEKWELHKRIDVIRDPSHTASLRLTALLKHFDDAGLDILRQSLKRRPRSFNEWMLRAGLEPSHARYQEARKILEDSIPGDRAGMSPEPRDGDLIIVHYEGSFLLGKK